MESFPFCECKNVALTDCQYSESKVALKIFIKNLDFEKLALKELNLRDSNISEEDDIEILEAVLENKTLFDSNRRCFLGRIDLRDNKKFSNKKSSLLAIAKKIGDGQNKDGKGNRLRAV